MVRRSRVAGVAVEDALELWAVSLREVKRRMRPLFTRERVAVSAGLFLDGLLGPERGKTRGGRGGGGGGPRPRGRVGGGGGRARRGGGGTAPPSAAAAGRPMRGGTSCATMPSRPWRHRMPCW